MSSFKIFLSFLLIASISQLDAAPRAWKSEDGTRSIQGEFVRRDATSVTILRADLRDVTIPLAKLHPEDLAWLAGNHPLPGASPPVKADTAINPPDPAAGFENLVFGDTRGKVLAKLKISELVELAINGDFIGRTGLNDAFHTRDRIGGLPVSLNFDWTASNGLREITLQTGGLPASALEDQLVPCWKEFAAFIGARCGSPIHADAQLSLACIQDGTMTPTHLWKLKNSKGSAIVGVARDGNLYQIVARFTDRDSTLVALP